MPRATRHQVRIADSAGANQNTAATTHEYTRATYQPTQQYKYTSSINPHDRAAANYSASLAYPSAASPYYCGASSYNPASYTNPSAASANDSTSLGYRPFDGNINRRVTNLIES